MSNLSCENEIYNFAKVGKKELDISKISNFRYSARFMCFKERNLPFKCEFRYHNPHWEIESKVVPSLSWNTSPGIVSKHEIYKEYDYYSFNITRKTAQKLESQISRIKLEIEKMKGKN